MCIIPYHRNCAIYTETSKRTFYWNLFPFTICTGTDPEDVIRNAFACFDEEGTGKINEDRLRELLTTMGDRFTDAEVCVCMCVELFTGFHGWLITS